MLGDTSEFGPLDLLGSLAVNVGSTKMACNSDMRVSAKFWSKDKEPVQHAYMDLRFIAGVASAAVGQFGGPGVRRVGHDLATGLLGSFVATETIRSEACKKAAGGSNLHQLGMVDDFGALDDELDELGAMHEGGMNASYGW